MAIAGAGIDDNFSGRMPSKEKGMPKKTTMIAMPTNAMQPRYSNDADLQPRFAPGRRDAEAGGAASSAAPSVRYRRYQANERRTSATRSGAGRGAVGAGSSILRSLQKIGRTSPNSLVLYRVRYRRLGRVCEVVQNLRWHLADAQTGRR